MQGSGRSPRFWRWRFTPLVLAALLSACGQGARSAPEPMLESPPVGPRMAHGPDVLPSPRASRPMVTPAAQPARDDDTLIVYSSRRPGAADGFDIFVYDMVAETVFSPPGLNTPGDELDPQLSKGGRYILYVSDYPDGDFDLRLYDLQLAIENRLEAINTSANELSPTITDDGSLIAYLVAEGGVGRLRLADLRTQTAFRVPVAPPLDVALFNPQITGDGAWVAFAALMPAGDTDIQLYDIRGARLLTPPFVNTPSNEDDPELSADGRELLYVTDRRGSRDVFLADLAAGFVDPLPLANSDAAEFAPSFQGKDGVLFTTTRDGTSRYAIYHRKNATLDTLPVMHEPGADDL